MMLGVVKKEITIKVGKGCHLYNGTRMADYLLFWWIRVHENAAYSGLGLLLSKGCG